MMPLAYPTKEQKMARVIKTEEKGSDVNLAAYLLSDAMREICDCAVVVTNDSDISGALKLVKKYTNVRIGVITPGKRYTSAQLKKYADFIRRIRTGALKLAQLPKSIPIRTSLSLSYGKPKFPDSSSLVLHKSNCLFFDQHHPPESSFLF